MEMKTCEMAGYSSCDDGFNLTRAKERQILFEMTVGQENNYSSCLNKQKELHSSHKSYITYVVAHQ